MPQIARRMGLECVPLTVSDAATFHKVRQEPNKDPFDRMLIRQALSNQLTLITKDPEIDLYRKDGLRTLW